jgi:hypothetical protein
MAKLSINGSDKTYFKNAFHNKRLKLVLLGGGV